MKTIPTIVLAAALVSLVGCKSSSPTPAMPPAPKTVDVVVKDFSYDPNPVQINSGDTVRWIWVGTGQTNHTVTSLEEVAPGVPIFMSGMVFHPAGTFFEHTFTQNNFTFEYSCDNHNTCACGPLGADMKGSVQVGSMPPPPMTGY